MYKTEDILNAAHTICPKLKELLGTQADEIEHELTLLLKQADTGEDLELEIFELLGKYESSRQWMKDALKDKKILTGEKGFSQLPGKEQPTTSVNRVIKLVTHVCANDSACDCDTYPNGWIPTMMGDCIPDCPKHRCPLMPE